MPEELPQGSHHSPCRHDFFDPPLRCLRFIAFVHILLGWTSLLDDSARSRRSYSTQDSSLKASTYPAEHPTSSSSCISYSAATVSLWSLGTFSGDTGELGWYFLVRHAGVMEVCRFSCSSSPYVPTAVTPTSEIFGVLCHTMSVESITSQTIYHVRGPLSAILQSLCRDH